MDDTRALGALSVVVEHGISSNLGRLGADDAKLREAKAASPLLFAEVGDYFWHPVQERETNDDYFHQGNGNARGFEVFTYMGRTGGGGDGGTVERWTQHWNGGTQHNVPPNWLKLCMLDSYDEEMDSALTATT
jgi:hypothetical protein